MGKHLLVTNADCPKMDKSEDSDGSISWEDFFGSSTDLVPTLLNMYDSLIASASEKISAANDQHSVDNVKDCPPRDGHRKISSTCASRTFVPRHGHLNPSTQVRWGTLDGRRNDEFDSQRTISTSHYPDSTNCCVKNNGVSCCSCAVIATMNGKMASGGCNNTNGNIISNTNKKTDSPPSCRGSVSQRQQRQIYGALSQGLCNWSSDSRKATLNRNCKLNSPSSTATHVENACNDERTAITSRIMNNEKLISDGKEQRPISVNSVISTTSSSSTCSSESSTSLSTCANPGRANQPLVAPRASPEDDSAAIPDADVSDEDENGLEKGRCPHLRHGIHQCANKFNGSSSTISDCAGEHNGINRSESSTSTSHAQQGDRSNKYDPNLSYMDRVVLEIVETEQLYTADLSEIISGYLEYWQDNPVANLQLDEVKQLFSNIEQIHQFNSEFLKALEGCGLDPVRVARCFVCKNEGFSIYTEYCTNYPRTMSILTEMMRHEQSAKSFRERQLALGHSLPLGSYLLKPVQRILKYHLMLQNILKAYDREAGGYDVIVEALSAMTNIAHHINDMKRRHEHAVRVQEIQSLLYGWQGEDLTTYGELCAEGTFRAYGAKALRHVFLFDKMLLIAKKKEDVILSYKTHIMCSNLMLIESVPGEPLSFHVIPFDNPRFQSTLQARNLEQKREWTLQLKRVILENYHAVIPSHARQLVMELGQCRPEDENATEKIPTKRQHSAPEYLERRKQERRKSESTLRARLRRARKSDPLSPKESPATSRRSRRTSVDTSREMNDTWENDVAIDRKMSSASCPPGSGSAEKQLVKKLSGWRRKSEPGIYAKNGRKGDPNTSDNGSIGGASNYTLDSNDSIIGEELEDIESQIDSCQEENAELADIEEGTPAARPHPSTIEERRESVEEIVGQLVMQNQEFQRILSKQRLVHLRKALAQHHRRNFQGEETASDTETEDQSDIPGTPEVPRAVKIGNMMKPTTCSSANTTPTKQSSAGHNESEASSSNGIGSSSSDVMVEMSSENISGASSSADEYLALAALGSSSNETTPTTANKNVQRTVSDPGNKANLTPRRFMNSPLAHYDPLSLLWSSFRRSDGRSNKHNRRGSSPDKSTGKSNIRHTHSFTCSTTSRKNKEVGTISLQGQNAPDLTQSKEPLPHGDSGVFPNSFTSDSSSSSEANIPTMPAVWLKQQDEHLATPNNKSGSLPRSFQVGHHCAPKPPLTFPFTTSPSSSSKATKDKFNAKQAECCPAYKARLRDFGKASYRPFTIASDKPSSSDMNYDEVEHCMSKFKTEMKKQPSNSSGIVTTADECLDELETADPTPVTSMENISQASEVHPDHKIYRSSKSSIKHMLLSVTQRLAGIKGSMLTMTSSNSGVSNARSSSSVNFGSYPNISAARSPKVGSYHSPLNESARSIRKMKGSNSPVIKGMYVLPRSYRKSLKQKLRYMAAKDDRDSDSENCESSVTCSSTSSGFSSVSSCESNNHNITSKIGARLAQSTEHSDYALAKLLGGGSTGGDGTTSRPRSILSMSSTVTSISSSMDETDPSGCGAPSSSPTKNFYRSGRNKAINQRDLYLSFIDQEGDAHSDSDASADSFYERSFEAIESLMENDVFPDSAIYSDGSSNSPGGARGGMPTFPESDGNRSEITIGSSTGGSPVVNRRRSFHSHHDHHNADINSVSLLAARLSNTRLSCGGGSTVVGSSSECAVTSSSAKENRRSRLVRSQVILEKLRHLEECSRFQRNEPASPSFEGMKSIQERRKELDLWRAGMSSREDESETSSQHSTSTINTVIELSPSKSTSFPSSRRCSGTDSSGGNSPLTERAVSRNTSPGDYTPCNAVSSVSCSNINASGQENDGSSSSKESMPKGWVKLVVGKLQGGAAESPN